MIAGVGDVDRAVAIDGNAGWRIQTGHRGDAVAKPLLAAGDGRDDPVRRDAANAVRIAAIRNVGGAVGADGNCERIRELRIRGASVHTTVDPRTREDHGCGGPVVRRPRTARVVEEREPAACCDGGEDDDCGNGDDGETTRSAGANHFTTVCRTRFVALRAGDAPAMRPTPSAA